MRKDLSELKELCNSGGNIMSHLKKGNKSDINSPTAIAISYDLQAGSYIEKARKNPSLENERAHAYASIINELGEMDSILEVGVGEATTLANVLPRLQSNFKYTAGFDISFSRIQYGKYFLKKNNFNNNSILFLGNLFHSPIEDDSIDIVYTNHALEPNGGNEKAAIVELFRITKQFLVLFEPSFELADKEAKDYITNNGYIKGLPDVITGLGYNLCHHRLLSENHPGGKNNTAVTIIKKTAKPKSDSGHTFKFPFACPITKKPMGLYRNAYFCPDSLLLYPIVNDIPCMLPENAIVATHYLDEVFKEDK